MEDEAADRYEAREFGERARADEDHRHHHGGELRVDRRAVGRVELGEALEERAVAGHRVVHAREDHDAAVERIEDGEHHRRADDRHAGDAEERLGGSRAEVEVAVLHHFKNGVVGKHAVDGVVEDHIENGDAHDRKNEGEREVSLRVLHFLGDGVEVRPPFIGPEGREDGEGHHREDRREGRGFSREVEEVGRLLTHEEAAADDEENRQELQNHEDVLHHGAQLDAAHVDEGEHHDRHEGDRLLHHVVERIHARNRRSKGERERGNGARGREEEVRDAAHEGDALAVGFAQVHVVAAGLRHHGAEFGKADARKERDEAADCPDEERKAEIVAGALKHDAADVEDAGADHDAGKNGYAAEKADFALHADLLRSGCGFRSRCWCSHFYS